MTESPIELGMFVSEADGDCHRCGNVFEIQTFTAFYEDQWTCPDCADAISAGFGDVIRGLDLVYNAATLDLLTRRVLIEDLNQVTWSLRKLADMVDDIAHGRSQLRLSVEPVAGIAPDEQDQIIGVQIHREVVHPASKETVK